MLEKLKKFGWGYILIGALLITVGVLFISAQDAYKTLAIIMGSLLAAIGIGFLIHTLVNKERGLRFGIYIAVAVIAIICGAVTMIANSSAIETIANIFFLILIIDGAFKLQLSIHSHRLSYYGWWIVTSFSVIIIISAFLLCKLTPSNPATLATLSGILIFADGVLNILSAFFHSAIIREEEKDEPKATAPTEKKEIEEIEKDEEEEE